MGQPASHAGQLTKEGKRSRAVSKLNLDAMNKEKASLLCSGAGWNSDRSRNRVIERAKGGVGLSDYLLPFDLLCVLQSIWQLSISVLPPFDQAVTWSAFISYNFQMRRRLASFPIAQYGQFEMCCSWASAVCCA